MKIVQCTPLFLPSEGGTQRAVFYLSKELLKLGHDVSVFTYNALDDCAIGPLCSSGLKSYEQIDGIEVRRFRYSSLTPGLCFSKAFSLSLLKLLVKGKVDIVHFQGFFNLPDIVINSMWGKVNGVPLCLTTHGLQEALSEFHRAHNGLMKILAEKTIKSVLASVDNFITLSRTDSSVLIDLGLKSSKIHYVPNGVDLTKFTNCRLAREVSQ
jgi:glycosyltransferase involved in cell wall biosynthesis